MICNQHGFQFKIMKFYYSVFLEDVFFYKHVVFLCNRNLFGNILSITTSFFWDWRKKSAKKQ
jgi:hypothetical protein